MNGKIAVALTELDGVGAGVVTGGLGLGLGSPPPLVGVVTVVVEVEVTPGKPVELKRYTLSLPGPPHISAELPPQAIVHPAFPSAAGPPPFCAALSQ